MRIIPVLDIKDGIVVAAKRGERNKYKPLESTICNSADPIDVAEAYERLGFSELYIADLGGIIKSKPNLNLLRDIKGETGLNIMVDVGVIDIREAIELIDMGIDVVIFATEVLNSLDILGEASNTFGMDKIALSVDTKKGHILSPNDSTANKKPRELIEKYRDTVRDIIVLDLYRVGAQSGPNLDLCKTLRGYGVIYGGGIRSISDILSLKNLASGVLVGTAIHNGKITGMEIEKIRRNSEEA